MVKNLKVLGIIAEYNPFHNGHLWQLQEAKKIVEPDLTIIILGGNYTQRGEMSILRREDKVKLALTYGADLVVGIPFLNNIQAVDQFAFGSVQVAKKMGVTHLVFGSEEPDFPYRAKAEEFLKMPPLVPKLKNQNYANNVALDLAAISVSPKSANHLLGFYYAVAAAKLNYQLDLIPLKRGISEVSSSKIRLLLRQRDFEAVKTLMPPEAVSILAKTPPDSFDKTFAIVKSKLLLTDPKFLNEIFLLPDELLKRSLQAIRKAKDYEDFIHQVKTKRYTLTRIKRIYLYLLLDIHRDFIRSFEMVEVWGFNSVGQKYLADLKNEVDLITNPKSSDYARSEIFCLEARANRFYDFIMQTEPSKLVISRKESK
ncbi:UPF0348 protein [Xylocopilactobacillus apicola]|uniref:tRNA(Met) cytidine acetate ligase n=1 Tax=Xylocopilactobacillus apicola TaxID=2932184 RepID=A0AAU9CWH7_9LACO|nr:UPF0348 protein [Xylocopilactobacillus apicola]